jgi:hypothetical protein
MTSCKLTEHRTYCPHSFQTVFEALLSMQAFEYSCSYVIWRLLRCRQLNLDLPDTQSCDGIKPTGLGLILGATMSIRE